MKIKMVDDALNIRPGGSYLLDLTKLRKTRPNFYVIRSAIQVLRREAEKHLDEFLKQAAEKELIVTIYIHGFSSTHGSVKEKIGSLKALKNPKMVHLYIDWDTAIPQKLSLLFLHSDRSRFITNGIENAYDIHGLLRNSIQKHVEIMKGRKKLRFLVLAHSMGSHVAEAFIKEHESIDLLGVIYFNPHADHTFYCLENVPTMYMSKTKRKGFVLSFNSSHDKVLSVSSKLQRCVRLTSIGRCFGRKKPESKYIHPLGMSWEKFAEKAERGHRVVVLHMKHTTRCDCWYPRHSKLNHRAHDYEPCREIANGAIELAISKGAYHISEVRSLVKNKHLLFPSDPPLPRPYGEGIEYVNLEKEHEDNVDLSYEDTKIRCLEVPEDEVTSHNKQDYLMQSISSYPSK